jgi:hypothetical protein
VAKYQNKRTIRCKVEATYNTDSAPTASDSWQVADLSWKPADQKLAERKIASGSKAPVAAQFVGHLIEVSFEAEVKGSGTAGTAPKGLGAGLQCCGFKETVVAVTSVTYKVDSTDEKSATIWFKDGDQDEWRLTGCRGQVTFEESAGDITRAKFTIRGHLSQVPTNTAAWTNTYDSTVPKPVVNVPLVVGGVTFDQSKITIDPGNALAAPALLNAADGFGEIRIPTRAGKLTATIYPPAASVASPLADLRNNTTKTLAQAQIGSAGNRYQFLFGGGGQYQSVDDGNAEGVITYNVTMALLESAAGADDELSLVFT